MEEGGADRDYYSILGAKESDARAEIERRYKRLAHRHHPDRGGDEEEMKALNEAWKVLGDASARASYDARRARTRPAYHGHTPATSPGARADPVSGRIVGAVLCVVVGLVLLLLVRAHYVMFLWPLALLAAAVVCCGVLMGHGALAFARSRVGPRHPARRLVWAQEVAFWSGVVGGVYGVYLLLKAF
jgi:curved DNA-binding protein CbpA